jgi:protein disulfide-isomerase A6
MEQLIQNKASSTLALLLTKDSKVPLLWKALGNRYPDTPLRFGAHSDKDGKTFKELFVSQTDEGEKTKVLLWVEGKGPRKYTGGGKFEPLTSFFGKLLEGDGDIGTLLIDQDKLVQHSVDDL